MPMNKLPKLCGPRNSDHRMLELSRRTNVLNPPKPKPVFWASVPHDRTTFKPAHMTVRREENVPTSRVEIKQALLGKPETSRYNNHGSSEASARLSRRTNGFTKQLQQAFSLINTMRKNDLEKYCKLLEERNHQLANDIKDADRHSFNRARELLVQSEKQNLITNRIHWIDRHVKAEIKDTIVEAEKQFSGLQTQLKVVKSSVYNAQSELLNLKNSTACLAQQITKLQDELTTREQQKQNMNKEQERQIHVKQQKVLSDTAKQILSVLPPSVKHLAFHNQIIGNEIHKHKQEIMELEGKNRQLRKSIRDLQQKKTILRNNVFQSFLKNDKCTPDMNVYLTIPRDDSLPI